MGSPTLIDSSKVPPRETRFVPLDHPLGERINVRGGGGKSTLANTISAKLEVPLIELDDIHWLP